MHEFNIERYQKNIGNFAFTLQRNLQTADSVRVEIKTNGESDEIFAARDLMRILFERSHPDIDMPPLSVRNGVVNATLTAQGEQRNFSSYGALRDAAEALAKQVSESDHEQVRSRVGEIRHYIKKTPSDMEINFGPDVPFTAHIFPMPTYTPGNGYNYGGVTLSVNLPEHGSPLPKDTREQMNRVMDIISGRLQLRHIKRGIVPVPLEVNKKSIAHYMPDEADASKDIGLILFVSPTEHLADTCTKVKEVLEELQATLPYLHGNNPQTAGKIKYRA